MIKALILDADGRIPTSVVTMHNTALSVPAFNATRSLAEKYEYRMVTTRHLKESELWMFAVLTSDFQAPEDEEKRYTFNYLWEKGKEVRSS